MSSRALPSSSVCTPCTPGASIPGRPGRRGRAPVASTSLSKPVHDARPPSSSSLKRTRPRSRSSSVTSQRIRRSMSRARCSSAVRAISASGPSTSPPTQYGIPQAEYEVKWLRSNAVIASSAGFRSRRACDAAAIPAASPPTMTRCSAAIRVPLRRVPAAPRRMRAVPPASARFRPPDYGPDRAAALSAPGPARAPAPHRCTAWRARCPSPARRAGGPPPPRDGHRRRPAGGRWRWRRRAD